jgi:hypothetical protein
MKPTGLWAIGCFLALASIVACDIEDTAPDSEQALGAGPALEPEPREDYWHDPVSLI